MDALIHKFPNCKHGCKYEMTYCEEGCQSPCIWDVNINDVIFIIDNHYDGIAEANIFSLLCYLLTEKEGKTCYGHKWWRSRHYQVKFKTRNDTKMLNASSTYFKAIIAYLVGMFADRVL